MRLRDPVTYVIPQDDRSTIAKFPMEGPAIQAPVTYSQIDGPRSQQGTMKVPHGVSFHELNVHGYTDSTDHQKSMGNLPLFLLKRLGYFIGLRRSKRVAILQQCNGVVHGGEMLLVLGRPGSGCTTFLRTIAGETCGVFEDAISKMNYQGHLRILCYEYNALMKQ